MENDWSPPELKEFTAHWTVDPSFSARYRFNAQSKSAVLRTAALGLVYEDFRPANKGEAKRFPLWAKRNPKQNPQNLVIAEYHAMPTSFLERLVTEYEAQIGQLLVWLDRIEADGHPKYEVELWKQARIMLGYAANPLRVHGLYSRIIESERKLDLEQKKRLSASQDNKAPR